MVEEVESDILKGPQIGEPGGSSGGGACRSMPTFPLFSNKLIFGGYRGGFLTWSSNPFYLAALCRWRQFIGRHFYRHHGVWGAGSSLIHRLHVCQERKRQDGACGPAYTVSSPHFKNDTTQHHTIHQLHHRQLPKMNTTKSRKSWSGSSGSGTGCRAWSWRDRTTRSSPALFAWRCAFGRRVVLVELRC